MIWHEHGGTGSRTVLLLHGMGATGAVWTGVRRAIDRRMAAQWIVADLSGHGGSDWQATYSVGQLAAGLVPLVHDHRELFIVAHSLGTYVGLALASGWFGLRVTGVLGIGPKVTWSDADLQSARELAARPVRWFATQQEAIARYRRTSGLDEKLAPNEDHLARGFVQAAEGYRLSQDPRTFMVAGAPFATLVSSAACRVLLARGEHDAMVSIEELRAHRGDTVVIAGAGHNAHAEQPDAVVTLLEPLLGGKPFQSELSSASIKRPTSASDV